MSAFTPSLRLHDRYVLRCRIGLGGMSEVWRADDEVLGRPVAVKVLASTFAVDPDLRATIRREARAAARLTHPHVTQVYDYGEAALPGGTVVPYLVMELVDGRNLADRLTDGPLPWPQALRLGAQIAAALAAAHRIGVVHRDIKPGNVMLTEIGAKVLDFGIAALAGPQHAGTAASVEPMMGTPAYTAPERLSAGAPNPASDVYALGALLYRTLTGDGPLPVTSWEDALVVHANRLPVPPPPVHGLPADLAELVLACLDRDPARRPTAGDLAARLRAGASGAWPASAAATAAAYPTLRSPASGPPPGRTRRSRRPVGALLAAGLALIVGVSVALALANGDNGMPAATPSTAPATPEHSDPPAPATPAAPKPSATPSTEQPEPASLRQVAVEFIGLLLEAQLANEIDGKAADRLRKDLTKLAGGTPKDRQEQIEDLREHLDDEVERGRIPAAFAERVNNLLDRLEATPASGER